jgi:addiction module RelB/DinJ family antitoxin
MSTAVISIETEADLKAQAQAVAADLGFTLSSLINAFLKNLTLTREITFRAASEEPSDYLIQALKESEADRKAGRYHSFSNADDAVASP